MHLSRTLNGCPGMIRYRGRVTVYGELWYDEEPPPEHHVDIIVYRQRAVPVPGARYKPLLSLVIDLTVPEGELMDQFGKDCRYKIKRAEARDGLQMEVLRDPAARLEEFCSFYDAFARQKSIATADRQWLRAACDARRLVLGVASRHGEPVVWHAHLVTADCIWLQYTGSCFRGKENDYRAMVGRANRWLHWREMLEFRKLGIRRYDWGGLFEDESTPERAGINRFKKEFGGHSVRAYDCVVPVTTAGWLWLPLRDAWRSRGAVRAFYDALLQKQAHS